MKDALRCDPIDERLEQDKSELTGPDGRIILPRVWQSTIRAGWTITMQIWQMSVLAPERQHEPGWQQQDKEREQRRRGRDQRGKGATGAGEREGGAGFTFSILHRYS